MITVFGSISVDLIISVQHLPKPGETVSGRSFETPPGGKGANQAIAAARAGARTALAGAIGNDNLASLAFKILKNSNVGIDQVRQVDGATGTAIVLVDPQGKDMIVTVPGANASDSVQDAKDLELDADHILLMQLELPIRSIDSAFARCRQAGARSILNIAPFNVEAIPFIQQCDYLIANQTEFEQASVSLGLNADDRIGAMRQLSMDGNCVVIVTTGAGGVYASDGYEIYSMDAVKVDVVDTAGAGDSFCGYFAAGILAGLPLPEAILKATCAGSLACTRAGAQFAIPTRNEVDLTLAELL